MFDFTRRDFLKSLFAGTAFASFGGLRLFGADEKKIVVPKLRIGVVSDVHIKLTANKDLPGFTLLCTAPIRFDDNRFYEYRKEGNQYYVWFKLKAYEPVIIEIGSASRRDDIPVIETN